MQQAGNLYHYVHNSVSYDTVQLFVDDDYYNPWNNGLMARGFHMKALDLKNRQ